MLLEPRVLVIAGDFNIHIDISSDHLSKKFLDSLASLSLQQHVHRPNHHANHTLDLVISRNDASILSELRVSDSAISDHWPILFNISLVKPPLIKKTISFRKIKSVNKEAFLTDICNSTIVRNPPSSLPELVASYHDCLSTILDKHAPVKSSVITVRPDCEWFNNDLLSVKQNPCKLDCLKTRNGLTVHAQMFSDASETYLKDQNKSKKLYYTQSIIEPKGNQGALF